MNPYRFEKKSTEKRRLFFDTNHCLVGGDSLLEIDSITVVDSNGADVSSSLIFGTPSIAGNTVTITIQNGTNGKKYICRIRLKTTGLDIIQDNLAIFIID